MGKRHFSIEEQDWFETKKLFEEEYEDTAGISSMNQTKEEMYQGLGRHYDAVFEERAGMSIEEFIKKHPTYYAFSEMVNHKLTGKKTDRKKRERLSKKDKLMHRLKSNLVAEKGWSYSVLKSEKIFEANYKALWIADCIAWAITQKEGVEINWEKKQALLKDLGIDTLQKWEQHLTSLRKTNPIAYQEEVPNVDLTSTKIRELLGRAELLNSDIHKLVLKLWGTPLIRRSRRLMGEDGDSYIQFARAENIYSLEWAETGKLSSRNQQPEYHYHFLFDKKEQIDFWLSVCLGYFDCRPKDYYKLKGGTQNIIRALCWTTEPTNILLEELCRIAGITTKDVYTQKKYISSYLNEAWEAGFIAGGKAQPAKKIPGQRKKEYWYKIFKVKQLPRG